METTFEQRMKITQMLVNHETDIKKISVESGVSEKDIKKLVKDYNKNTVRDSQKLYLTENDKILGKLNN